MRNLIVVLALLLVASCVAGERSEGRVSMFTNATEIMAE